MTPDSKWLEILKASGWQTTAIAIAIGITFSLIHNGVLASPDPLAIVIIATIGITSGCLAIASILSSAFQVIPISQLIARWWRRRQEGLDVEKYIPYMTVKERDIIAYLLCKNEKTFECEMTGGYANTLISRGIVVRTLRPGQSFSPSDMPVSIPDHVWDVLVKHKNKFPYSATDDNGHPWRIPWGAR